jgi:hypothetical protein
MENEFYFFVKLFSLSIFGGSPFRNSFSERVYDHLPISSHCPYIISHSANKTIRLVDLNAV